MCNLPPEDGYAVAQQMLQINYLHGRKSYRYTKIIKIPETLHHPCLLTRMCQYLVGQTDDKRSFNLLTFIYPGKLLKIPWLFDVSMTKLIFLKINGDCVNVTNTG